MTLVKPIKSGQDHFFEIPNNIKLCPVAYEVSNGPADAIVYTPNPAKPLTATELAQLGLAQSKKNEF